MGGTNHGVGGANPRKLTSTACSFLEKIYGDGGTFYDEKSLLL